jgi:hypothetical protein
MKSVIGYQTQLPKASVVVKKESKMETFGKVLSGVAAGITVIAIIGLLCSLPVMWLWNAALVPAIPGIKTISWLQAWAILILCNFLFKPMPSSKD